MRLVSFPWLRAAALAAIVFTAAAKDGRDFAGFYSLTDVSEQGDQIQVTLDIQLFNYSGADLKQTNVSVYPSRNPMEPLHSFSPVSIWRSRGYVVLKQTLLVSREQFEEWASGTQPNLAIVYTDASGEARERSAQLSRRPQIPF